MIRNDVTGMLYASGLFICGLVAMSAYDSVGRGGPVTPYLILMGALALSMAVLLITSRTYRKLSDEYDRPMVLTMVSGPVKEKMRSRGIVGKMPPMSR